MELPPSGWYPDPYGVPGLLRWWDGSTWTQHTHQAGGAGGAIAGDPGTPVPHTTVQPAVPATSVQPTVAANAVQSGPPATTIQPVVPPTTIQPTVPPTTVQPAMQPAVAPTSVQPTSVQPTTVQPGAPQGGQGGQGGQGTDANGTQVLFLGDNAWSTQEGPGGPGYGGPGYGGPGYGDPYGYQRAQRRRRMWLMGGLAGGTALALGLIALIVSNLSGSPAPAATHTPATRVAATTPPTSAAPSASAPGSVIDDGTSGLSYTALASPWQAGCPSAMDTQGFSWSTGEAATAGQFNGGQSTWYGVACSGQLPQQYGYNGVAALESTATNIVNAFNGAYYAPLQHGFQQEVSQPVTISGHAGWEIKFLISYTNAQAQGLQWTDEQAEVVVADLGAGIAPAVFYVSIPGNLGEGNVDSLVSSLQLTNPPQPGAGGSPGDGSPGDGSPAPSSPGDNGNGNGHGD